MNIKSVGNKFSGLTNLISEHVDIVVVAETKLNLSFRTAQFLIAGFCKLFWQNFIANRGGFLVYVNPLSTGKIEKLDF